MPRKEYVIIVCPSHECVFMIGCKAYQYTPTYQHMSEVAVIYMTKIWSLGLKHWTLPANHKIYLWTDVAAW